MNQISSRKPLHPGQNKEGEALSGMYFTIDGTHKGHQIYVKSCYIIDYYEQYCIQQSEFESFSTFHCLLAFLGFATVHQVAVCIAPSVSSMAGGFIAMPTSTSSTPLHPFTPSFGPVRSTVPLSCPSISEVQCMSSALLLYQYSSCLRAAFQQSFLVPENLQ